MPHYHFSLVAGCRDPDDEGTELPNDMAAQDEAMAFLGEMLRDNPRAAWGGAPFGVEVTNALGQLLWTITTLAVAAPKPRLELVKG